MQMSSFCGVQMSSFVGMYAQVYSFLLKENRGDADTQYELFAVLVHRCFNCFILIKQYLYLQSFCFCGSGDVGGGHYYAFLRPMLQSQWFVLFSLSFLHELR